MSASSSLSSVKEIDIAEESRLERGPTAEEIREDAQAAEAAAEAAKEEAQIAHRRATKARLPAATHKELMGELGRRFREEKAANAISNGAGARPSNARLADLSECVAVDDDEEAAAATAAAEEEERLLDEAVAALHLA